ncbi:MAG: nucleotidyltransferase domain-containing protein [Adlercreutzia equolifaciens]
MRHHRSLSFDSYARNEADEESDVDICIECGDSITLFSWEDPALL